MALQCNYTHNPVQENLRLLNNAMSFVHMKIPSWLEPIPGFVFEVHHKISQEDQEYFGLGPKMVDQIMVIGEFPYSVRASLDNDSNSEWSLVLMGAYVSGSQIRIINLSCQDEDWWNQCIPLGFNKIKKLKESAHY